VLQSYELHFKYMVPNNTQLERA